MALMRGKLFAGALFAGLLLGQSEPAIPDVVQVSGGGFSPLVKARKFKKADRDEIVQAVRIALEGEPVAVEQVEEVVAQVVRQIKPKDYSSEIAQYEYALAQASAKINAIIEAELDDEESLLLLM